VKVGFPVDVNGHISTDDLPVRYQLTPKNATLNAHAPRITF